MIMISPAKLIGDRDSKKAARIRRYGMVLFSVADFAYLLNRLANKLSGG
jgi:hypothetical protein